MIAIKLPDIEKLTRFPTIGPGGEAVEDIKGGFMPLRPRLLNLLGQPFQLSLSTQLTECPRINRQQLNISFVPFPVSFLCNSFH